MVILQRNKENHVVLRLLPLTEIIQMVADLLNDGCDTVTKQVDDQTFQFDFGCKTGSFRILVQRRIDGIHQIVQLKASKESTVGFAYQLNRSQNSQRTDPVMLAELYRTHQGLGKAIARLLQSSVVSDDAINHVELVRVHLPQSYLADA